MHVKVDLDGELIVNGGGMRSLLQIVTWSDGTGKVETGLRGNWDGMIMIEKKSTVVGSGGSAEEVHHTLKGRVFARGWWECEQLRACKDGLC